MTLVTLALSIVPEPLRTVQFSAGLEGCVTTVTEKAALLSSRVPKSKVPLPLKLKESPPLSCSTKPEPVSPVTVPPTVYFAPPVMGHPDRVSAAAPNATLGNSFTSALRKKLQPPTATTAARIHALNFGDIHVKKCLVQGTAPRNRPAGDSL